VVIDAKIGSFLGEKSPWAICLFCGEAKVKMSQHLRLVHKSEERLVDLQALPQKLRETGMEHLIREGNYRRNNQKAAATYTGVIIPVRRNQEFRHPQNVAQCQFCYACVDTSHFSRHVSKCHMALSTEEECRLVKKNILTLEK
jgi:hypothetical protein